MNIAMTIWERRISPVFDAAHELMVASIKNQDILEKRFFSFNPDRVASLIDMLEHDRVSVMICGAISEMPARMIVERGIHLIPFISGNVDNILGTYAKGKPLTPIFLMPGCGRQNGVCKRQRACGRNRGYRPKTDSMDRKRMTSDGSPKITDDLTPHVNRPVRTNQDSS